jgi:GntR family transcriptional regulator
MSYVRYINLTCFHWTDSLFYVEINAMNPSSTNPHQAAASPAPAVAVPSTPSAPSAPSIPIPSALPARSPLYRQIKDLMMQSLQSGEWKPGDVMPSEMELATRYKVSQGTVRKAIDELAAEKLVWRHQGKGTFVATHHEARTQFRFLRLMPDDGVPYYPESKFLEVKRTRAPAEVARLLELKVGDSVVYIKRVQYFNGSPTIVEELWLSGAIFKGLTAERLNEHKGPMYALFEVEFNTTMIRATEKIRAVAADQETATLLQIAADSPLLSAERVSFTYGDKPVELRRGLYLTAQHYYANELN